MKDKIKAAFEISTRRTITGIVEKMIEILIVVSFDEHKEENKKRIRNMVESALIDEVEQGRTRFIDAVTRRL